MPDPGVAPTPDAPDGVKEMRLWQAAQMPATQQVQEQAAEENLQRQAGMQQTDIDRYWGRAVKPSLVLQRAIGANLTHAATASNGNLDFLTDPVGTFAAMMGVDPQGVKETLDATASNFTGPMQGAWQGLEAQQRSNWQHALSPTAMDTTMPAVSNAVRGGMTLLAAGNVVFSPVVGAINTVGAPAGKALADAGAPLPHLDVNLKSEGSNILDPTQWQFNLRAATRQEAEQGYGNILTGLGAIAAGEVTKGPGPAPGPAPGATAAPLPIMSEAMRAAAVDAMRKGQITDPIDVAAHGGMHPDAITPSMRVALPRGRDFAAAAGRMLGPEADTESVLRVTKTLQDMWRDTGLRPEEIVRRAGTDATLREELLTQNVTGDPIAPRTQAAAPKPRPAFGQAAAGPSPMSIDAMMHTIARTEGSPDTASGPQISKAGAVGEFQIMPSTARAYGFDPNRLGDPAYNHQAARVIITDLYRRFNGDPDAIAIAYNGGISRAHTWLREGPGTRLVANVDPTQRSGWRFTKEEAAHDESGLPLETQRYAAVARAHGGGEASAFPPGQRAVMDTAGRARLTALRANPQGEFNRLIGKEVTITSEARTPERNRAVGGAPDSEHLTSNFAAGYGAWDIKVAGMTNAEVIAKIERSGLPYDQLIEEGDHVHVGFGPRTRGEEFSMRGGRVVGPQPPDMNFRGAPHSEVPAEVDAAAADDPEARALATAEASLQRDRITSGGLSAQSVWDDADVGSAYGEIAANMGDQRDVEPVKGLSLWDRAVTALASRLQPAKAVDDLAKGVAGTDPEREFSTLDAFRQAAHSDDRAKIAMGFNYAGKERGGVVVRDGDRGVKVVPDSATARGAIQQAIRDGGNPDDFMRWLVARRAMNLARKGTETPFNILAVNRIMQDKGEAAKYAAAAKIWDQFTKGVRDYAQASGRYSKAQIAGMEDADLNSWISFRRLTGSPVGVTRRGFTVGSPVRGMKGGSMGMLGDPLSNSLDNVSQMFRAADNNMAIGKLISLAEANPDLAATLGLRKARVPAAADLSAVEKEMKAFGIPEDQWEAAHDTVASLLQEREHLADNEFAYYRDGQREVWQAAWPELVQMIKGSTPVQAEGLTKVFQTIAHGVQGSVTALPDFAIKMFASHQMVQFINDPLHPPPFLTGTTGLIKMMGMDGMLEHVMANGGLGSSLQQLDRDFQLDTMTSVLGETGYFDRIRNDVGNFQRAPSLKAAAQIGATTVLTPFRMMRAITERLDMGNRTGVMAAGERAGMDPLKAGARAAEYGIDYTNRAGSSIVNWWAQMVPFMRASLLYSEQAVKAIERNPAAYIVSATAAVALPKMLLYAANMVADQFLPPDQQYKNLPAWERMYYFITPPIAGQRLKLRMPDFASFPFGAVPEAIMMAMHEHDPATFRDIATTFLHDYVPPTMPPALQAPLEASTNTNLETWQPLVPNSMTGIAGQLRWINETSGPAQALAKALGPPVPTFGAGKIPPMSVLSTLVNGWADGPGRAVLSALGAPEGRPGAPADIAKLPFVSGFLLANPEGGRALDDFYEAKDQFDQWAQAKTELRHEVRRGGMASVADYAPEAVRFAQADRKLQSISVALSRQRDALYGIDANKSLTADEKRQRTNQILDQYMIPMAQSATQQMRAVMAQ